MHEARGNQHNPIDRRSFLKSGGASAAARAVGAGNTSTEEERADSAEIAKRTTAVFEILSEELKPGEAEDLTHSMFLFGAFSDENLRLAAALHETNKKSSPANFLEANGIVQNIFRQLISIVPDGVTIQLPIKLRDIYEDLLGSEISRETLESSRHTYIEKTVKPFEARLSSKLNSQLLTIHLRKILTSQMNGDPVLRRDIDLIGREDRLVDYEELKLCAKKEGVSIPTWEEYSDGSFFHDHLFTNDKESKWPELHDFTQLRHDLFGQRSSLRTNGEEYFLCLFVEDLTDNECQILLNGFSFYRGLSPVNLARITLGEETLREVPLEITVPSGLFLVLPLQDEDVKIALEDMKETLEDLALQPLKYSIELREFHRLLKETGTFKTFSLPD